MHPTYFSNYNGDKIKMNDSRWLENLQVILADNIKRFKVINLIRKKKKGKKIKAQLIQIKIQYFNLAKEEIKKKKIT